MHKVLRFTALAILAASGLTACGDKVTNVTNNTSTTPTTSGPGVVRSVTVTPNAVSLSATQTVQLVATVDADAGVARTVTWSTSAASVATVDNTGKVTAVAAGTAVIIATSTADAGKQGTSAITVAGTTNPSITIGSMTDQNGAPTVLNNVSKQLNVTLNVDPGSTFLKTISLILNCGAGDVVVATQNISDKAPVTGPSGVSQPITLSFNTADTTSAGVPKFKNGQCTVKAQLTTTSGSVFNSANSVQITLANVSGFTATVTTVNSHGGSWPQSAISTADGLQRVQGNVTLTIKALNYGSGVGLQTASVSFMGITTNVSASAGQTFVINYPNDSTKTLGFGVCTSGCMGVYQHATLLATGEAAPIVNSSIDSSGNNPTGLQNITVTLPAPFRLDNQAPNAAGSSYVNANAGSQQWLNAAYSFIGNTAFKAGGDAIMGATTVKIGYSAAATFTPLPGTNAATNTAGTAYGDAYCNIAPFGSQVVTSASAIPTSTNNMTYSARAFEYDPLGNVRCTDLTVANGGVAANTLAFGVDNVLPLASIDQTNGVAANTAATSDAGKNFVFVYSDTGSGFNPDSAMRGTIVKNFATTFATAANCTFGNWTGATKQTCLVKGFNTPLSVDNSLNATGYYTITAFAQDQAGNQSTPTLTQTFAVDAGPVAVTNVTQAPAKFDTLGAGGSVTGTATDALDLSNYFGMATYTAMNAAGFPVNANFQGSTGSFGPNYDATFVQSATPSATLTNVWRHMQNAAAAGGQIEATGVAPGASLTATNVAGTAASGTIATLQFTSNTVNDTLTTAGYLFNNTQSCGATACTSATLTATFQGPTASFPNPPFATIYFYYPDKVSGNLLLIGSQTLPNVTDTGGAGSIRTFTWTLGSSFTMPAGYKSTNTIQLYAVGVTADGHAIITGSAALLTWK